MCIRTKDTLALLGSPHLWKSLYFPTMFIYLFSEPIEIIPTLDTPFALIESNRVISRI